MSSTQQQQRETAEKISDAFVEAYNTGDVSLIEPVVADDFVCHHLPAGVELNGAREYAGRIKELRGAFSDLSMEEEFMIVEGDMCAARFRWGGTHDGTFQGIDPTGRKVDTTSIGLMKVEDGKLSTMWIYGDGTGLMEQLGIER